MLDLLQLNVVQIVVEKPSTYDFVYSVMGLDVAVNKSCEL